MRCSLNNRNGTTLIESLIAGILLAVVVVGVATMLSGGSFLNRRQSLRKRVVQELERVLEDIQVSYYQYQTLLDATSGGATTWPSDDPSLFTFTATPVLDDRASTPVTGNLSVTISRNTYTFSGQSIPAIDVTARMTWDDDNDGNLESDSLETVLTVVAVH